MRILSHFSGNVIFGVTSFLLIILFCFLPSVVLSELNDPTQSGKLLVFLLLIVFLAACYCFALYNKEAINLKLSDGLLLLLFAYLSFNKFILNNGDGYSVQYLELLGLGVLYLCLRQYQAPIFLIFFVAVIIGGCIQAIYGMLQLHRFAVSNHNLFYLTGSFFNPGPYAGYLASVFPVALGIYLFKDKIIDGNFGMSYKVIPYLAFIGVIIIMLVLPVSMSRAAWIAVAVSSGYLIFIRFDIRKYLLASQHSTLRRSVALSFTILAVATLALGIYMLKQDSSKGRLFIWKVTSQMTVKKIWFGYGFDMFKANYMNQQGEYFEAHQDSTFAKTAADVNSAFNEPLEFIAENGIIGTVLFFLVLFTLYPRKYVASPIFIIAKAGLISVFVFSLFSYPSQILPIKLNAILYVSAISSFCMDRKVIRLEFFVKHRNDLILKGAILAASLAAISLSISYLNKLYDGYRNWDKAYTIYQQGMYKESIVYYKKAYPVFFKEGKFLMQYGKALSMRGAYGEALGILGEAKRYLNSTIVQIAIGNNYKMLHHYKEAEQAYSEAWSMVPDRLYPGYLLAKLYVESNQTQRAIVIATVLISKKPKVPSEAVAQIQQEMRKLLRPLP